MLVSWVVSSVLSRLLSGSGIMIRTLILDLLNLSSVNGVWAYICGGAGGRDVHNMVRHRRSTLQVKYEWWTFRQTCFICDRAVSSSAILDLRLLTWVYCVWYQWKSVYMMRHRRQWWMTGKQEMMDIMQTWLICDIAASSSAILVLRVLTVCTSTEHSGWSVLRWITLLVWSVIVKMALPSGSL